MLSLFHLISFQIIHLSSSFFLMNCGIRTNRKSNYPLVSLLPFIFVSCSRTLVEVRLTFFCLKYMLYIYFFPFCFLFHIILSYFFSFSLFYFILFHFIAYFISFYFISNHPFVVFLLFNELRHLHIQEVELSTCVFTSFHFCQLFTDPC